MFKKTIIIVLVATVIIMTICCYEFFFSRVTVNILNAYIDKPVISIDLYDIQPQYVENIKNGAKALYLEIEFKNTSFVNEFQYVNIRFMDDSAKYPIICSRIDMGGESGIKTIRANSKRTQCGITALVDGTLSDAELLDRLSCVEVVLTGRPRFSNNEKISRLFKLFDNERIISKPFKLTTEQK